MALFSLVEQNYFSIKFGDGTNNEKLTQFFEDIQIGEKTKANYSLRHSNAERFLNVD